MSFRMGSLASNELKHCSYCQQPNLGGRSWCEVCNSVLPFENEGFLPAGGSSSSNGILSSNPSLPWSRRVHRWMLRSVRHTQGSLSALLYRRPELAQPPDHHVNNRQHETRLTWIQRERQAFYERLVESVLGASMVALIAGGNSRAQGESFMGGVERVNWNALTDFFVEYTFQRRSSSRFSVGMSTFSYRASAGLDEDESFWASFDVADRTLGEEIQSFSMISTMRAILHHRRNSEAPLEEETERIMQRYPHPPATLKTINALPEEVIPIDNKPFKHLHEQDEIPAENVNIPIPGNSFQDTSLEEKEGKDSPAHSRVLENGNEISCCAICLEGLLPGNRVKTLPCSHRFHSGCVKEWLLVCGQCPLCKKPIA